MYAPQNFYCYALDAKSTTMFHAQMRNLSKCFPNVLLTNREFVVDSAGHNTSRSFLECLRVIRRLPGWKYAILLQVCHFYHFFFLCMNCLNFMLIRIVIRLLIYFSIPEKIS